MFKNRTVQILGATLLIVAAVLVTLSAIEAPAQTFIPVTGENLEGLAQYHRSERGMPVANPNGLAIYYESERMQPVNWTKSSDPFPVWHIIGH